MTSNNKNGIILLTIISIATLLVAVVGATFAYFSISVNGNNSEKTIEVTSGTLSVEYGDNSKISGSGYNPGDLIASKTVTMSGIITGSSNLTYEIDLKINENTFDDGALYYTISSVNEESNGVAIASVNDGVAIPTGSTAIVLGKGNFAGPISSGANHIYTINIYVKPDAVNTTDKVIDANISAYQATK